MTQMKMELTDLMQAARDGDTKLIDKIFLTIDIRKIHSISSKRLTALGYAVIHGHLKAVELLIKKGARVNNRIIKGSLDYVIASTKNEEDPVFHLENKDNELTIAIRLGRKDIFMALLESVDISKSALNTALIVATHEGNIEFVEALIKKKADVNYCFVNPEISALSEALLLKEPLGILQLLIEEGADVLQEHAFIDAMNHPEKSVRELFLSSIQEKNISKALKIAVNRNDTKILGILLARFPQHVPDKSLLFQAITNYNVEIVELLINNRANTTIPELGGIDTPLMSAIRTYVSYLGPEVKDDCQKIIKLLTLSQNQDRDPSRKAVNAQKAIDLALSSELFDVAKQIYLASRGKEISSEKENEKEKEAEEQMSLLAEDTVNCEDMEELQTYLKGIRARNARDPDGHLYGFEICGFKFFRLGFSAGKKNKAAEALEAYSFGAIELAQLQTHIGPLENGKLSKIYAKIVPKEHRKKLAELPQPSSSSTNSK